MTKGHFGHQGEKGQVLKHPPPPLCSACFRGLHDTQPVGAFMGLHFTWPTKAFTLHSLLWLLNNMAYCDYKVSLTVIKLLGLSWPFTKLAYHVFSHYMNYAVFRVKWYNAASHNIAHAVVHLLIVIYVFLNLMLIF